jgi:hypothetical protein
VEPVRIKLYGLFSMTRRRYIAQLIVFGLLLVVVLSAWFIRWLAIRDSIQNLNNPSLDWVVTLLDLTPWFVLIVAVLQVIEAWFVLRAFARKQAAQPPGKA